MSDGGGTPRTPTVISDNVPETNPAGAQPAFRMCTEWADEDVFDYDNFADHETFEQALVALAMAAKGKGLIPAWGLWQKAASYLADLYDDAPEKEANTLRR